MSRDTGYPDRRSKSSLLLTLLSTSSVSVYMQGCTAAPRIPRFAWERMPDADLDRLPMDDW